MLRRCPSHMRMANSMSSSLPFERCFEPVLSSVKVGCH